MKKITVIFAYFVGLLTSSNGAISIEVQFGEMLDSNSNLVAETSVWAIIYDADGDGFLPGGLDADSHFVLGDAASAYEALSGQSIITGNSLGLDRIVWAGVVDGENTSGAPSIGATNLSNFTFDSLNVAPGGMWGVYWFPGLTETQRLLAESDFEVGAIQIDSPDSGSGGDIGMRFPTDDTTGNEFKAYFYNTANGGGTPDSNFTAIVAVPESSTSLLMMLSTFALLNRRRV